MTDTRSRPREGAMQLMAERPGPMFYDSWAVCPGTHDAPRPPGERDGDVWVDYAHACYRCKNGHVFDARYALWEVQSR